MKKILLLSIFFFSLILSTKAQDISSIIRSMPDEITLQIADDQKELLATPSSDTLSVVVTNALGGEVKRESMSKDYVAIKTSDRGMLQIKLFPLINNSYIVGVIRTVCGMACDSQIDFYTTDWKPLRADDLFPQKDENWFIKKDTDRNSQEFKNAYAALDMTPVKYQFSPDRQTITATYDIKGYLSEDDYKLLEPYLIKDSKIFTWDKSSFQ